MQDALHELQTTEQQNLEKCKQEVEEEKVRLIRKYEQDTEFFQKKLDGMITSLKLTKAKLKLNVMTVAEELKTLCVKYEIGEE